MNEQFYVYIMTNHNNTVLYTGITSDLKKRIYEHKHKLIEGFTTRYNIDKLVYFEIFSDSYHAISREKQIKSGSRKKKILLIESVNPDWKDLSDQIWYPDILVSLMVLLMPVFTIPQLPRKVAPAYAGWREKQSPCE